MYAKPEETTADLLDQYRAATAAADRSIDELDLDATGTHHTGVTVTLRWMLLNVLTDTSRHGGHADIVRELIDGSAGHNRAWSNLPGEDPEHEERYLARVRGEIDTESWVAYVRERATARPG
jgi:hypothetical protein